MRAGAISPGPPLPWNIRTSRPRGATLAPPSRMVFDPDPPPAHRPSSVAARADPVVDARNSRGQRRANAAVGRRSGVPIDRHRKIQIVERSCPNGLIPSDSKDDRRNDCLHSSGAPGTTGSTVSVRPSIDRTSTRSPTLTWSPEADTARQSSPRTRTIPSGSSGRTTSPT